MPTNTATQDRRHGAVRDRPADDPVDVVEPVAQDGDADRDRDQRRDDDRKEGVEGRRDNGWGRRGHDEDHGELDGGRAREPLDLLVLRPGRAPEPDDDRRGAGRGDDQAQQQPDALQEAGDCGGRVARRGCHVERDEKRAPVSPEGDRLGTTITTSAMPAIQTIGAHRRDGRRPSGKTRSRRIKSTNPGCQVMSLSQDMRSARGNDPGSVTRPCSA